MEKAITPYTIFIVIFMGMIIFAAILIFYKFWGYSDVEATRASCTFKFVAYCTDWKVNDFDPNKKPWNWNDRNPKGCEKLDPPISEPTSANDCKEIPLQS